MGHRTQDIDQTNRLGARFWGTYLDVNHLGAELVGGIHLEEALGPQLGEFE